MQEIYYDNSATTQVCQEALAAATLAMTSEYGNPSSVHGRGAAAFRLLNSARTTLARAMGVPAEELYFTSCGTESNNTAVYGAALSGGKRAKRLLISSIEHPSVEQAAKYLMNKGFSLEFIPVDRQGVLDLGALRQQLNEEVALVSVMHVNNETGTIQPLRQVGAAVRELAPEAVFHVDAVQSFARLPLELKAWQADACTISGHKIHAPKGVAALWLRGACRVQSLLRGGGQEKNFRSGTENMPGILALSAAAEEACTKMEQNERQISAVRKRLLAGLQAELPDLRINSPDNAAAHILNISFLGARSEVLLHYLEQSQLYVSSGSACTSKSSKGSHVLEAMQLPPDVVDSALRFSFSRFNTLEEAERAVSIIVQAVQEIRCIMGRNKKKR
ncbi:MAG: cysteine desulfurase family protein [Bacillota bacterium]|nr:cysteine desulfurase family protein [Bacillota bacterium]